MFIVHGAGRPFKCAAIKSHDQPCHAIDRVTTTNDNNKNYTYFYNTFKLYTFNEPPKCKHLLNEPLNSLSQIN